MAIQRGFREPSSSADLRQAFEIRGLVAFGRFVSRGHSGLACYARGHPGLGSDIFGPQIPALRPGFPIQVNFVSLPRLFHNSLILKDLILDKCEKTFCLIFVNLSGSSRRALLDKVRSCS